MDATKDYFYSTWDDNRLRAWLEDHGVETKPHHSRTDLLGRVNEVWHAKVNDPIYHSWSDNYLKSWLVAHGILSPPHERDRLIDLMKKNYWDAKDTVFSGWDKESMRQWLVSEGVLSSDAADLSREKYSALLADVSPLLKIFELSLTPLPLAELRQGKVHHLLRLVRFGDPRLARPARRHQVRLRGQP